MTRALRLMLRALAAAMAMVCAWMGIWHPAEASAVAPTSTAIYVYDGHHHSAPSSTSTSERGPPAEYDDYANDGAVDRRSDGASARPSAPTTRAIHDYDDTALLACADRTPGVTNEPARAYNRALSSFQRWQVAANNVPTVVFSRSRAPGIAGNFDNAVANGAPTRLTRVDAAARDANRRAALRGQSPAPAGQSLDEYPFACSAQGGCGSFVSPVPVGEQSYQGGVLSQFFQRSGVQPGDIFDVMFGP